MNSATLLSPRSSQVSMLLRRSPLPDLRRLEIEETEDEVIILGIVSSYYSKQLAQETIRPAVGDRRIRNRVVVVGK